MTTRRGFLKAMLAACAAPAIVKAENLMKVVAPKGVVESDAGLYIPAEPSPLSADLSGEFTMETWVKPAPGKWAHIALVSRPDSVGGNILTEYVDGKQVSNGTHASMFPGAHFDFKEGQLSIGTPAKKEFYLDDFRVTSLAREPKHLGFNQRDLSNGCTVEPGWSKFIIERKS